MDGQCDLMLGDADVRVPSAKSCPYCPLGRPWERVKSALVLLNNAYEQFRPAITKAVHSLENGSRAGDA